MEQYVGSGNTWMYDQLQRLPVELKTDQNTTIHYQDAVENQKKKLEQKKVKQQKKETETNCGCHS